MIEVDTPKPSTVKEFIRSVVSPRVLYQAKLASLAVEPINSYLEMGVQHGGTFATTVTYLEATGHQLEHVTAIESVAWGLVFIDGDHSYHACPSDFEMAHRSGARIIAMHDVCDDFSPGSRRVWQEVQADHAGEYEFVEFLEQYPEVTAHSGTTHLGIGVAKRAT